MNESRFTKLELEKPRDIPLDDEKSFCSEIRGEEYYLGQAKKYRLAGYHEYALRSYSIALGENPLSLKAWIGQLLVLLELAEYPETHLWADKALELFPDHPQILAVKSIALYRMGHLTKARDLSDSSLRAKGESDIVWLCRGELMLGDSRPAAEECFRHALRLSEDKDITQLYIGSIFLRYQKCSHALFALQKACSDMPESAWAWYLLGLCQKQLGLIEQAKTSFKQAVELAPYNKEYIDAVNDGRNSTIWESIASIIRSLFNR